MPGEAVRIVEVGPRDGLQNIKTVVPTSTKLELIERLRQTGHTTIEVTSCVSPQAIPQMADSQQVLASSRIKNLIDNDALRLPVLVPNVKGLDVAIKHGVREVAVFLSASEGFSRANINVTVEQGLRIAREVTQKALAAGLVVRGYVSCIFADPFDGPTPPSAVLKVARALLDAGCYEVSLGDTLGIGVAADVRHLLTYLYDNGIPASKLAGHFHDTYGQAVSNVWQAYQLGLRVFDTSVGGLGGCPFAPGAKGNAATEDIVYLFHNAGIATGVDLERLAAVGEWISKELTKLNDSRAGAALIAKSKLAAASKKSESKTPQIEWTLIREDEGLKINRSGANIELLLNKPKNGNALTVSMITSLTRFFEESRDDNTISRIIIRGAGKFWCTGMDLGKGTSPVAQSKAASDAQYNRLYKLFDAIDRAPQVTIACINGSAFGGGVGLAFACDIRLAVKSATMTLSEVKLGLCAATISKYVTREWGLAFTREAILSARAVSVEELKALGVISELADGDDQLLKLRDDYVSRLKVAAPGASHMSKELVRLGYEHAGAEGQAEGIKALFDKMMRADGEGAVGLREFQAGRRNIDWDSLAQKQKVSRPKL